MGSCYSSASHNLSPSYSTSNSAPFSRPHTLSLQLPSYLPSHSLTLSPLKSVEENLFSPSLLFNRFGTKTAAFHFLLKSKVKVECKTPPPPSTKVALPPNKSHQTPDAEVAVPSLIDLRPRKVNFKSPLKVPSPCQTQAKGKRPKASRLLSHLRKIVWRRKEKTNHFDEDNEVNVLKKVPDDVEGT